MDDYLYRTIEKKHRLFYSLNFLFAKCVKRKQSDINAPSNRMTVISSLHNNNEVITGRFYKNISTLFDLNERE
jgi:hypothetical protein